VLFNLYLFLFEELGGARTMEIGNQNFDLIFWSLARVVPAEGEN